MSKLFTSSLIQVPYITVEISGLELGLPTETASRGIYPSLITNITVDKVANAGFNNYVIYMSYAPLLGDDPNFVDKLLSKSNRNLVLTYGDFNSDNPSIRKKVQCIISGVKHNLTVSRGTIDYVLTAYSSSVVSSADDVSFPNYTLAKPSEVLVEVYNNNTDYRLKELYPGGFWIEGQNICGLSKENLVTTDIPCEIETKTTNVISYIVYLTKLMEDSSESTSSYYMYVSDEESFQSIHIDKMTNKTEISGDYFELVYGVYDTQGNQDSPIIGISSNQENLFSIFEDYNQEINYPNSFKSYISDDGDDSLTQGNDLQYNAKGTIVDQDWWAKVTSFPLVISIVVRGLASDLKIMEKIKFLIYYYGEVYNLSGLYSVLSIRDEISSSGYRTTITMVRTSGLEFSL